jgi:hypothetical protein
LLPAVHSYESRARRFALPPRVLDLIGDAHHAAGDHDAARDAWQQSLTILDQLGTSRLGVGPSHPDADEINAKLHRLGTPRPSRPTG